MVNVALLHMKGSESLGQFRHLARYVWTEIGLLTLLTTLFLSFIRHIANTQHVHISAIELGKCTAKFE